MTLFGLIGKYNVAKIQGAKLLLSTAEKKAVLITGDGLDSWNGVVSGPTLGSGIEAQAITQLHSRSVSHIA